MTRPRDDAPIASEPLASDPLAAQRRALAALFQGRYGDFVGMAALVSGQPHLAEDLVQDAFAAAYRRATPLDDLGSVGGYVARSVVNGARSARRRRRFTVELGTDPDVLQARSAEGEAQLRRDRAVVRDALARLPQRQRECAVCHLQFGLSHAETAAVLGLRVGTVKTHVERARRRLVSELEEQR